MKKLLFYLLVILSGVNCSSTAEVEKGVFPDNLVVEKTSEHQRILGANLFAKIPASYEYSPHFRFKKSENEFIILSKFQIPFDYEERKLALHNLGTDIKTMVFKELNFNNKKVLFKETVNVKKNEHAYILNYGNDEFSVMIMAQSPADKTATRHELLEIMKSVFEDPTVDFDPLEICSFTFDRSIANFKLAQAIAGDIRYTATGKYEPNNKIVNSIFVNEMASETREKRVQLMEYWASTYQRSDPNQQKNNWIESKMGSYDLLEYESEIELNGVGGYVYFVILSDDQNRTMKFTGIAFEDIQFHMKKYKETVKSIKFN